MRFTLIIPLAPERDAPIIEAIKKLDYDKNKFHVVVVKGKNPSANRNKGVEKAKGEYVIFLSESKQLLRKLLPFQLSTIIETLGISN